MKYYLIGKGHTNRIRFSHWTFTIPQRGISLNRAITLKNWNQGIKMRYRKKQSSIKDRPRSVSRVPSVELSIHARPPWLGGLERVSCLLPFETWTQLVAAPVILSELSLTS